MTQVNAGRVRFIGRGEYDNSTQYYTFDLVNYNGNSYFAKSNTMGNLPTNSTYWQLVAEKGNVGPAGPTGNGIDHISLTSQSGATKVYTIYFTDGNTTTFTVEDGEVTQEVFDEEIERANMIYNAMPKTNGEGTNLTLNNTAECPVYDVELSPSELEQETTSGKNLFNASIIPNTTQIVISNNGATITMPIKTSGAGYTITSKKLSDLCPNLLAGETYYLNFDRNLGTSYNNYIYLEGTGANTTWVNGTDKTITNDLLNANVVMYANNYNQGETAQCILTNFRITKNSTDTWEEYTGGQPSPNPDYPQEIHTVSGNNTITISNSDNTQSQTYSISLGNLEYCKIGDYEDEFRKSTGKNLVETIDIYNGYIIGNVGQIISYGSSANSITYKKCTYVNANKQYTLSWNKNTPKFEGTRSIKIIDNNNIVLQDNTYSNASGNNKYTFIANYSGWLCVVLDANATEVMINEGTTALPYEPYGKQWYLKKNVGKVVFTGANEENWTYTATNTSGVVRMMSNILNGIAIGSSAGGIVSALYCDKYLAKSPNQTYLKNVGMSIASNGNVEVYDENYNATSSPSLYKTWLSTNNVLLYYPTTTPTYTLLSDTLQTQLDNIQKAITYQDQTNVSQTNADLTFVIKMSAIRDLSGIFEEI